MFFAFEVGQAVYGLANLLLGLVVGAVLNFALARRQRAWALEDDDRRIAIEHNQWLRDRRREAYQRVLVIQGDFGFTAAKVGPHVPPREELVDRLNHLAHDLVVAEGAVTLFGSPEAVTACADLVRANGRLLTSIMRARQASRAENIDAHDGFDAWCAAQGAFESFSRAEFNH